MKNWTARKEPSRWKAVGLRAAGGMFLAMGLLLLVAEPDGRPFSVAVSLFGLAILIVPNAYVGGEPSLLRTAIASLMLTIAVAIGAIMPSTPEMEISTAARVGLSLGAVFFGLCTVVVFGRAGGGDRAVGSLHRMDELTRRLLGGAGTPPHPGRRGRVDRRDVPPLHRAPTRATRSPRAAGYP